MEQGLNPCYCKALGIQFEMSSMHQKQSTINCLAFPRTVFLYCSETNKIIKQILTVLAPWIRQAGNTVSISDPKNTATPTTKIAEHFSIETFQCSIGWNPSLKNTTNYQLGSCVDYFQPEETSSVTTFGSTPSLHPGSLSSMYFTTSSTNACK